jgi:sialate O-acetylesterase
LRGTNSKTFEIAGEDEKYFIAKAKLVNGKIELTSRKVSKPTFVRYLWTDFKTADLYNGFGLPASPFLERVKED